MADTTVNLTVQKHPLVVLRERLETRSSEIKAALPGIPPERFIRAVITAAQINPDILACQFQSLWIACMRACRDGLMPDGVEGAVVPYKDRASWVPMYRGMVRKFQESGQFKWITANVVYEGEQFDHWIDEYGEHVKHVPSDIFDDKLIQKVYAMATTLNGGVFIVVLPKAEIDKIRKVSRASREDSPWNVWFSEMAKKTALKRLAKMLPSAPIFEEEQDEIAADEAPKSSLGAPRVQGAAAALDVFAGSPDAVPPTDSGETGGGGDDASDGLFAARSASDASATAATDDSIAVARQRGQDAKQRGYKRGAMPTEYRDPARDAEAQAWIAGHSEQAADNK